MEGWLCLVCTALAAVSCAGLCGAEEDDSSRLCSVEQAVRLDAVITNTSGGYVDGRVQTCEEGRWKNLCGSLWTEENAKVTCRSLNYTTEGN